MNKETIQKDNPYMDKIKVTEYCVSSEILLNQLYSNLTVLLREQSLGDTKRLSEQNEWSDFWKQLLETYNFLKNDYTIKLEKEESDLIKSIMNKWCTTKKEMTIEEASSAYEILLKIMSHAGFHNVLRRSEEEDDDEDAL